MEELWDLLPPKVSRALVSLSPEEAAGLTEIRLRVGQAILFETAEREYGIREGKLTKAEGELFTREEADWFWKRLCRDAPYGYLKEQRAGYITVGGHRVGFTGVFGADGTEVQTVGSFCVRICREIIGCGIEVYPKLWENGRMLHTLLVSPPGCGKTTLLRDLIRLASGDGCSVSVADEREEIAAPKDGRPSLHLGKRTDVLWGMEKSKAAELLVRAMRPDVLAMDELGSRTDREAAERAMTMGVTLLATAHGRTWEDAIKRLKLPFERYIVLDNAFGVGHIAGVLGENGRPIEPCRRS